MKSFSEFVQGNTRDEYVPYIRELMSWDCRCPASMVFRRNERGLLYNDPEPSPLHWSRQTEWPWVLTRGDFRPEHTVLDIGGGWAVLQYALASRCRRVVTLDLDQDALDKAAETARLLNVPNIEQVRGDARSLPYADGSFSRVVAVSTLEHIPEKGALRACREIRRVLSPGGLALITMDVTVDPKPDCGNFYISIPDAEAVLADLGVGPPEERVGMAAFMAPEDVHIFVLMILYRKPGGGVSEKKN